MNRRRGSMNFDQIGYTFDHAFRLLTWLLLRLYYGTLGKTRCKAPTVASATSSSQQGPWEVPTYRPPINNHKPVGTGAQGANTTTLHHQTTSRPIPEDRAPTPSPLPLPQSIPAIALRPTQAHEKDDEIQRRDEGKRQTNNKWQKKKHTRPDTTRKDANKNNIGSPKRAEPGKGLKTT